MQVTVIRLRRNGLKLAADDIRQAKPVAGQLKVTHVRPGHGNRVRQHLHAVLLDARYEHALPMLEPAVIKRIDHRGLLIVGVEHVPGYVRKSDEYTYPQAWWCVPAGAELGTAAAADIGEPQDG